MKNFETKNRQFSISEIFEGCIFGWTQIVGQSIFFDGFFQSALDFQGGDDGTALREIAGQKMQNARPSSKMRTLRPAEENRHPEYIERIRYTS